MLFKSNKVFKKKLLHTHKDPADFIDSQSKILCTNFKTISHQFYPEIP